LSPEQKCQKVRGRQNSNSLILKIMVLGQLAHYFLEKGFAAKK